jgi:hypothetical protein
LIASAAEIVLAGAVRADGRNMPCDPAQQLVRVAQAGSVSCCRTV